MTSICVLNETFSAKFSDQNSNAISVSMLSVSFFLIPTGSVYEMLNVISALSNVIADLSPKVCHDVFLF